MKVHIVLDLDRLPDRESRLRVVSALEQAFSLQVTNRSRAERYGVISAEVRAEDIERIKAFDAVKSCRGDGPQSAL